MQGRFEFRGVPAFLVCLFYEPQTRDHPVRTLRQKHGMQGKRLHEMPVQQSAAEFERGTVHQRELRGVHVRGVFGGIEGGVQNIDKPLRFQELIQSENNLSLIK